MKRNTTNAIENTNTVIKSQQRTNNIIKKSKTITDSTASLAIEKNITYSEARDIQNENKLEKKRLTNSKKVENPTSTLSNDGSFVSFVMSNGNMIKIETRPSLTTNFSEKSAMGLRNMVASFYDARVNSANEDRLYKKDRKTRYDSYINHFNTWVALSTGMNPSTTMTKDELANMWQLEKKDLESFDAEHIEKAKVYSYHTSQLVEEVKPLFDTYSKFGGTSYEYRKALAIWFAMHGLRPSEHVIDVLTVKNVSSTGKHLLETGDCTMSIKARKFVTLTCDYLVDLYRAECPNFDECIATATKLTLKTVKHSLEAKKAEVTIELAK